MRGPLILRAGEHIHQPRWKIRAWRAHKLNYFIGLPAACYVQAWPLKTTRPYSNGVWPTLLRFHRYTLSNKRAPALHINHAALLLVPNRANFLGRRPTTMLALLLSLARQRRWRWRRRRTSVRGSDWFNLLKVINWAERHLSLMERSVANGVLVFQVMSFIGRLPGQACDLKGSRAFCWQLSARFVTDARRATGRGWKIERDTRRCTLRRAQAIAERKVVNFARAAKVDWRVYWCSCHSTEISSKTCVCVLLARINLLYMKSLHLSQGKCAGRVRKILDKHPGDSIFRVE
jgi:hypothetical protein